MSQQSIINAARIFAGLNHKLVEPGRPAEQNLPLLTQFLRRIRGLRQILLRQLAQANLAVHRHENIHHERNQRLVGADIRGCFFAANMLFARCQGQNKSAPALLIGRLAHQPAGHLPHKFLARSNDTAIRSAESQGHAERLRLHRDNVGFARRLNDSQRNCLSNRNHQQRAILVRDLCHRCNILDGAEEIRRLDQHARGLGSDRFFQMFQVQAATVVEVGNSDRHALMRGVGGKHLAILGMQAARDDYRSASRESHGHHYRFSRGSRAVIHGSVGHFHPGQFANHRLKFEDRLQRALRNLRLVGRISGQEFATRNQRIDNHWPVVQIRTCAEKTGIAFAVFVRSLAKEIHNFRLGHLPRDFQVARKTVFRRNRSE